MRAIAFHACAEIPCLGTPQNDPEIIHHAARGLGFGFGATAGFGFFRLLALARGLISCGAFFGELGLGGATLLCCDFQAFALIDARLEGFKRIN
ncbi:MAG: hypothetical protein AAFR01_11710, partial [Pseudomonadota bacterium]